MAAHRPSGLRDRPGRPAPAVAGTAGSGTRTRGVAAPSDRSHVLAVDLGTGGPKVGLVDFDGAVAWRGHEPVATELLPDGGAVQDAEAWWRAILSLGRDAVRSGLVDPASIVAVSVTGQYASTVPVDPAGVPVAPCVLWMDRRAAPLARARFGGPVAGYDPRVLNAFVRTSGGAPSLSGADPIGQRLLLSDRAPEAVEAARWLLEPIDALVLRFCGTAAATPATMATSWLLDTRRTGEPRYDRDLLRRAGVDARRLPPLAPIGSPPRPPSPPSARSPARPAPRWRAGSASPTTWRW